MNPLEDFKVWAHFSFHFIPLLTFFYFHKHDIFNPLKILLSLGKRDTNIGAAFHTDRAPTVTMQRNIKCADRHTLIGKYPAPWFYLQILKTYIQVAPVNVYLQ